MATKTAFATDNFPWGSLREQGERFKAIGVATRAHARAVWSNPRGHLGTLTLLLLGLIGLTGDAFTTYAALSTEGPFSESNNVAAKLMGTFGLGPYVLFAFFTSLLLLPLIFVRGGTIVAWVLLAGGVTFIGFKLFVTMANLEGIYSATSRYE